MSESAQITADLTAAGFSDVRIEEVTLTGRSDSARDVTRGFCLGSPLRAPLAELGDVEAFADDAGQRLTTMLGDGPVAADMMAVVVEATP